MKRKLIIFLYLLLIAVPTIISIFIYTDKEKYVKDISILYNYGPNADLEEVSSIENYIYEDKIWENYKFFSGIENDVNIPKVNNTHDVDDNTLFSKNECITEIIEKPKKLNPLLIEKIEYVIENANIKNKSPFFKQKLIDEIVITFEEISNLQLDVSINNQDITLDFSSIEPELVLSIILYESGFNPYALVKERSIINNSEFIYSRGLMQIYEVTLWTLNNIIDSAIDCKYSAVELWSIEKNIFLGYLYLSYINETKLN